jgi:hypothetical protein
MTVSVSCIQITHPIQPNNSNQPHPTFSSHHSSHPQAPSYLLRSLLAQIVLRWQGLGRLGSLAVKYESSPSSALVFVVTASRAVPQAHRLSLPFVVLYQPRPFHVRAYATTLGASLLWFRSLCAISCFSLSSLFCQC